VAPISLVFASPAPRATPGPSPGYAAHRDDGREGSADRLRSTRCTRPGGL